MGKDFVVPSEGSNTGQLSGGVPRPWRAGSCTSRELCGGGAGLQTPAYPPGLEGLASGCDGDGFYLQTCWTEVELPADAAVGGAFCPGQVDLGEEQTPTVCSGGGLLL